MSEFTLSDLNPQQQEAATHKEGPALIIAGPGSGKTRVLTYRVANLLLNENVAPYHILLLTFTRKAANIMRERLQTLLDHPAKGLWIGTFHSIFARILRREATHLQPWKRTATFSIYDREDSQKVLRRIIKELNLDRDYYKPPKVLRRIAQAKNKLITAEKYGKSTTWLQEDTTKRIPLLYKIYEHYESRCQEANALDFDDIPLFIYRLFRENKEVLNHYQHHFEHILVDEFQDTDKVQYAILKMLAQIKQNLFVIGDDAQSIYSFRGADIANIQNYHKVYPQAKVFKLTQNYRSTQTILDYANILISHNPQHPKTLITENEKGEKPTIHQMDSDLDEADFVSDHILHRVKDKNTTYDHCVVLYRNNIQSRPLEEAFVRKGIPHRVIGTLSFYQRKAVKDILAYLHVIVNPNNEEARLRALNEPKRNIGPITIAKVKDYAIQNNITLWEAMCRIESWMPGIAARNIKAFTTLITDAQEKLTTLSASQIAKQVVHSSGIIASWQKKATDEALNHCENAEEFLHAIQLYCEKNPDTQDLPTFLSEITLLTSGDEERRKGGPEVKLMTIHKAKGLEFPYLYIVGVEEELFPSVYADTTKAVEEERRVFFVAITRAQKDIQVTWATSRYKHGQVEPTQPSRFLANIDPENYGGQSPPPRRETHKPLKRRPTPFVAPAKEPGKPIKGGRKPLPMEVLTPGQRIHHDTFGPGQITAATRSISRETIRVLFDDGQTRTLVPTYAPLSLVEQPPYCT